MTTEKTPTEEPATFPSEISGTLVAGSISVGASSITAASGGGIHISPTTFTTSSTGTAPARKSPELVTLPPRLPKRVLVAFFDKEDDLEPSWAAYLDPLSVDLDMNTKEPEESLMLLTLSLEKRFTQ